MVFDPKLAVRVQIAFGADMSDPDEWVWADVTADLRPQTLQITRGRGDEMSQAQPAEVTVQLSNEHGWYTPGRPQSPYYPHVVVGTPLRVLVDGLVRFVGQIGSWVPEWPHGDLAEVGPDDLDDPEAARGVATVTVTAAGILRRLEQGRVLESALRRHYTAMQGLVAYMPLEESTRAGSLVPGAQPATIRPWLEPEWGGDDTCPGSAPLPKWPVVEYHTGPTSPVSPYSGTRWTVFVTIRVPEGSHPCSLVEWRTAGVYGFWRLSVTSGGFLRLEAETRGEPQTTLTINTTIAVNDGRWRTVAVGVVTAGLTVVASAGAYSGDIQSFIYAHAGGNFSTLTRIRPIPAFLFTPDDNTEPIGLGHVAVVGEHSRWTGPADGWAGEPAAARIARLCSEAGIPIALRGEIVAVDDFGRTGSGGWGSTSDGRWLWFTDGTGVSFSVQNDAGRMLGVSPAGGYGYGALDIESSNIDALVCVDWTHEDVAVALTVRNSLAYAWIDGETNRIGIDDGDVLDAPAPVDLVPNSRYWLRFQACGPHMRMRVWADGDPEPDQWHLAKRTERLLGAYVTFDAFVPFGAIVRVHHAEVSTLDGEPLGPEPRDGTLLDVLRDAEAADMGILHEQRAALGLRYVTRAALYNAPPVLTLDGAAEGVGDILNPFVPVLDDAYLRNDIAAQRPGGTEVRAVDPESIAQSGVYADSVTVNVASDDQVADQAQWRLWHGSQSGMRYPAVAPALDVRPDLYAQWAAVDIGDRVDIIGLPPQHSGDVVRQIVQGGLETLAPSRYGAEATLAPYGPYQVAVWDRSRYAPARCVLSSAADLTGTEAVVVSTTGAEWSTDTSDWDDPHAGSLELLVGGVRVRVVSVGAMVAGVQQLTVARISDVGMVVPAGAVVGLADERPIAL